MTPPIVRRQRWTRFEPTTGALLMADELAIEQRGRSLQSSLKSRSRGVMGCRDEFTIVPF
jgi:hypothetical protein